MRGDPPADPLSIRLSVSYQGLWWQIDGKRERPERWIITATAGTTADETRHVGEISLAIADLTANHDLFDAAVLGDWVVDFLEDAVADRIHGTLVRDLEEQISAGPHYLVVLRHAVLREAWRGYGLGAPLTASALRLFARYTRFAACRMSPTDFAAPGQDPSCAELASHRATDMLEAIGFRRWRDVHILDVRSASLAHVRNRALDRRRPR